jgi:glutamate carboxypeptidase
MADPQFADPVGPWSDDLLADLRRRADAARAEVVRRLELLVTMESPSGDAERLGAVGRAIAGRLTDLGADVETVPAAAGDHLRAYLGPAAGSPAGEPPGHLLLVGHMDTVWPVGTLARRPFRVDGNWAHGPGTVDMKGAIVAVELAVDLVRELGVPLARQAQLVLVSDEEVSSTDGRKVVFAAAEGACAVLGLEAPHVGGDLKNGRRGVARVRLEVEGRESHAGLAAGEGVSAIDELIDQLVRLRRELPGEPEASCNVGLVTGGTRPNVVAGHASAELGLRFATPEAEQAVLSELASLSPLRPGALVRTTVLSHRPAWQPSVDGWLTAFVRSRAALLGEGIAARPAGGAGDTNFTGAAGLPTVDGLGPDGRGAHASDERVRIDSILRRAELLALLLTTPLPPAASKPVLSWSHG